MSSDLHLLPICSVSFILVIVRFEVVFLIVLLVVTRSRALATFRVLQKLIIFPISDKNLLSGQKCVYLFKFNF